MVSYAQIADLDQNLSTLPGWTDGHISCYPAPFLRQDIYARMTRARSKGNRSQRVEGESTSHYAGNSPRHMSRLIRKVKSQKTAFL